MSVSEQDSSKLPAFRGWISNGTRKTSLIRDVGGMSSIQCPSRFCYGGILVPHKVDLFAPAAAFALLLLRTILADRFSSSNVLICRIIEATQYPVKPQSRRGEVLSKLTRRSRQADLSSVRRL